MAGSKTDHRDGQSFGSHSDLRSTFTEISDPVQFSSVPFRYYRDPNIPGIDGSPILPPPAIFFIIFCISRN